MMNPNTPARRPASVVLLILSALVATGTVLILYSYLLEYGPTTGSRVDGAVQGLTFGAVPLLVAGGLAAFAFGLGRRSVWSRGLAVAVVVLSVGGVVAAGAQAAVNKYERLPRLPNCSVDGGGTAANRTVQEAFAGLEHPGPFGAGWSGVSGCGGDLLNVTLAEAAAHYRERLPAAGWSISRDSGDGLAAGRGELLFVLSVRCGRVSVGIRMANAVDVSANC